MGHYLILVFWNRGSYWQESLLYLIIQLFQVLYLVLTRWLSEEQIRWLDTMHLLIFLARYNLQYSPLYAASVIYIVPKKCCIKILEANLLLGYYRQCLGVDEAACFLLLAQELVT